RLSPAAAVLTSTAATPPGFGQAEIKTNITGPGQLSTIAGSGLKSLSGDHSHQVSGTFGTSLKRDLELCGYFRLLDQHAFIEDPQQSGYELGQFNFGDWRSINTDFLIKGAVTVNGSNVQLTAFLFDVAQQRRMMGKNYTGEVGDVPRM